jgi:hypothetical protein
MLDWPATVAQWQNSCLFIPKSRVRVQPPARHWEGKRIAVNFLKVTNKRGNRGTYAYNIYIYKYVYDIHVHIYIYISYTHIYKLSYA